MSDVSPEKGRIPSPNAHSKDDRQKLHRTALEDAAIFRAGVGQMMADFAIGTSCIQWAYFDMPPTALTEPDIEDELRPRDGALIVEWPVRAKGVVPSIRLLTNEVFWIEPGVHDVTTKDIMVDATGWARMYAGVFRSRDNGETSGDSQAVSFALSPSRETLLIANMPVHTPTAAIVEPVAHEDENGVLWCENSIVRPFGYSMNIDDCRDALDAAQNLLHEMKSIDPQAVGRATSLRRFVIR